MNEAASILAVDDEPQNNDLVVRAFRSRREITVETHVDPEAALEFLTQVEVDILLVDFSMPRMSGVEFLRRAAKIQTNCVSIMVTGFPELDAVMRAQDEGLVRHILAKPWQVSDLVSAIERALTVRDMNRAVHNIKKRD